MNNIHEINELAPHHITVAGVKMPTEWSVTYSGKSVIGFYELDGDKFKVVFTGVLEGLFTAAMAAAKRGETTPVNGEDLMTVIGTATLIQPRKIPKVPNPDKQRHGDVPEKWFAGQSLTGPEWTILFDGDAGKTRVIFPRKPAQKVIDAVKAAGFYWSPSFKSWNKGLNFRAYRAAEKLHAQLHALTA